MINEETLGKMYEGLIENRELTTKELNSYGFNSKDLSDLIQDGALERIKRGSYSFHSVDDLFYYGKQLIVTKEYDKAIACFEKCYKLDPTHIGVCFQLFLKNIQTKDYDGAFEYFEKFYNVDSKGYNTDSNFYLYLLNMITDIPENYKKYARFIQFEDIKVDFNDKHYDNAQVQNRIRTAALNQKFSFAIKQLNDSIKQSGRLSIQDIILRTLLYQAVEEQSNVKKKIISLIVAEEYIKVASYLEELDEQRGLSVADRCTLKLVRDLNTLIKTGKVPEKQIFSTDKLFDAIDGKNYELALSLSSEYLKKLNINANDNAVYILLSEITKRLSKNIDKHVEEETLCEEPKKEVVEQKNGTVEAPSDSKNTFADVINFLMKNDLENSFRTLRGYLNSINKSDYEFLIVDLIKISLMETDIAFTKPMIALTYVSRGNFVFDISEYIQNFYEALAQNKFDEARVYLHIITKSNKLGQSCVLTEGLQQVLNTTEKMLNYKRNTELLNQVDNSIAQSRTSIQTTSVISEKNIVSQPDVVETVVEKKVEIKPEKNIVVTVDPATKNFNDESFINGKLEELYKNGIVLLKPMNNARIKNIHRVVQNIPNVVSFSIGDEDERRIVLRVKTYVKGYFDLSTIFKEGNAAYQSGDYDLCISKYRQLLEFGYPNSRVYAKLGLSYIKKFNKALAIDYLTIANELAKKEKVNFDYTELIARLEGIIPEEDKKPMIKMEINEFENDLSNNYGIENLEQVLELISTGLSLNDVCSNLDLDDDQKCVIALIFAKNCYANKNYTLGDQYLKLVERTKGKSKSTSSLFNEVRKNKKFYANRVDENNKALVLTPKKKV